MTRLNDLRELDGKTAGEDEDDWVRRPEEILDALLNRPAPTSSVAFIPAESRVTMLSNDAAQTYDPLLLTSGHAGQPLESTQVMMNQTIVRSPAGGKVASIVPAPLLIEAASTALPVVAIEK
jgi:hypothetical protein